VSVVGSADLVCMPATCMYVIRRGRVAIRLGSMARRLRAMNERVLSGAGTN